ncbi:MAG: hypothetical protein IJ147_03480 [Lachnospiraceae bacterium]|nr:hypothetical protein [Lachnospiraceae bacterium]
MKIDSAIVGMESARSYQSIKTSYRRFSVREYQGGRQNLNNRTNSEQDETGQSPANAGENKSGLYTLQDWQNDLSIGSAGRVRIRTNQANRTDDNTWNEFRQLTIRYIFELLFGDRSEKVNKLMEKYGLTEDADASQNAGSEIVSAAGRQFQFTEETYSYEQETTAFSTLGTVRTADGREINFNVNVGMSREFTQTFAQDLNLSFTMCDPLVINLDTDVARLSDQKFYFDLDADGEEDEISMLGSGSGYLALDANGDGTVNDGSELFGTRSGNGFADLARYDEDGNGWIDENDAVWSKLKIWTKDEQGRDVLYRLAEKGVGAICLQNAGTDFTLQGANGQTNGAIRNTGVFLYENGNVGTIQHVDVTKYDRGA